ncbi:MULTISPECIES: secretin N-terminal domain-containing protein [Methylotenera]|uniref:secretin N-terminal domain-containing protein n=1 Tax=Methylotenera TaxID=359407 RepID=UPI00037C001F
MALASCAYAPWEKSPAKGGTPEEKVAAVQKRADVKADAVLETTIRRKDLLVTKELAVKQLAEQADLAKEKGQYDEADIIYDRILSFLPEDPNAIKGKALINQQKEQDKKLQQATELFAEKKVEPASEKVREVLMENPQQAKAIELQKQIEAQINPVKITPPSLKPPFDKLVSLELRDANIKVVFEALSRATGINFILDKDIKPDTKATIFIKKARIDEAIDMVLSSNGLQKKALSDNTALVFPSTPQKFKDYKDLVIRSFFFTNTNAKQVSALLKTMLKTKDIFVDERLNMLVMRDTPEVIKIAEKLIAANDLEDPEVMLDIEVLEVSRNRLQELGIIYPNQLSVVTADALTLESLKAIKSANIGVSPNPAINFKKTTGDVNLLSNPRIRVKNNEKAKILVGDKVPIITTTSTANVGISENVQYVDVGLKLDVEPRVTLDNFVNIKVGLEVSSLGERTVTRNGATVYTIGTRNASTVLRLKNGETQVLAGLILDDERKNASKLPGLGDLPLIGRLFSNQEDRKSKTEIVLAITPRIIGNITRPQVEITEYWSGTESLISDKPQVNFPPTGGSENPQDRIREQMRLRQLQLNENQEIPVAQEPIPETTSEQIPQQNSSQDGRGVLEQQATDSIQPPATNPIAAPEAIPSVIDSSGRLRPATQ